jgi:predicted membrane-bound mannosyltransferase
MKNTTPHWVAIALLLAIIAGIGIKFMVLGSTGKGKDGRTAVLLTQTERQQVLAEMRMLLEANQQIVEALANDDRKAIQSATQPVGSSAVATMDVRLKAKLPFEFKKLGFATHDAFDAMGSMAAEGRPMKEIQIKLATTMNNCIACHAAYQLPASAPGQ